MPSTVEQLCQAHKLTVSALADRTSLEETRIAAIVMGRWTPSPSERQRIAVVFGVAVEEISWGHKTPIQHLYGHGPG